MLNKEVCKACINKSVFPWNNADEIYWLESRVHCPYRKDVVMKIAFVKDECPVHCKYFLEQTVLGQEESC